MSIRGKAFIAGAYEHPGRKLPDLSTGQIYSDVARGAASDAGVSLADVDGLFVDMTIGSFSAPAVADYLGVRP